MIEKGYFLIFRWNWEVTACAVMTYGVYTSEVESMTEICPLKSFDDEFETSALFNRININEPEMTGIGDFLSSSEGFFHLKKGYQRIKKGSRRSLVYCVYFTLFLALDTSQTK